MEWKTKKTKIVIADDELLILKGLTSFMNNRSENFEVVLSTPDGNECLQFIKKNKVDLMLLDINMPDVTGLQVAQYVNEMGLDTEVYIISGYQEFEYARKAIEYKVKHYLTKPIDFTELAQLLQDFLNKKEQESNITLQNQIDSVIIKLMKLFSEKQTDPIISYFNDILTECYMLDSQAKWFKLIVSQVQSLLSLNYREFSTTYVIGEINSAKALGEQVEKFVSYVLSILSRPKVLIIESAQKYIMDHLSEEITLNTVASYCNMNANYFSRLFHDITNQNFVDYLIFVRINCACEKIKKGENKIYYIAESVGYKEYRTFARAFKRVIGMSPNEYREKIMKIRIDR